MPSPDHSPLTSQKPRTVSAKGGCRQLAVPPDVTGPRIQSSRAPDRWRRGQRPWLKSGEGGAAVEQLPASSHSGAQKDRRGGWVTQAAGGPRQDSRERKGTVDFVLPLRLKVQEHQPAGRVASEEARCSCG